MFMAFEPLAARRDVTVTERRTKVDWALWVKELVDVHYPDAEGVVLVMDNLNVHSPASLYEAFEPQEAKRIADKLEIHYTPKHGSWLNMAEIELSVLRGQCLDRRTRHRNSGIRGGSLGVAPTSEAPLLIGASLPMTLAQAQTPYRQREHILGQLRVDS